MLNDIETHICLICILEHAIFDTYIDETWQIYFARYIVFN